MIGAFTIAGGVELTTGLAATTIAMYELGFTFEEADGKTLMTMVQRDSRAPSSATSIGPACRNAFARLEQAVGT